jgi:RND family efflux transporter MFP subunit
MKTIIQTTFIAILLVACNASSLESKKKSLEELKKEQSKLEEKIKALELEIAKLDTSKKTSIEAIDIKTQAIASSTFETYIDIQGKVDADQSVAVSSQMPGMITQIRVKPGDEVSKGQVLAETDASTMLQQLSDLETNLNLVTQIFIKQQNLWNQNIGTELQFLQAKTNKLSLEKKVGLMREQIRMTKIISPINGTVDAVNVKVGQTVAPGLAAINVVNFSHLKVKAELAETYSNRIKEGNTVQIFFPDINDSISAKVSYASKSINPMSRTFTVEVPLANNKNLRPNMVAKLKIKDYVSIKPTIVIPVKFIKKGVEESYVLIAKNGKAVKKKVLVGKEYNGLAEIISGTENGVTDGDLLIIEGYDLINDGDPISLK